MQGSISVHSVLSWGLLFILSMKTWFFHVPIALTHWGFFLLELKSCPLYFYLHQIPNWESDIIRYEFLLLRKLSSKALSSTGTHIPTERTLLLPQATRVPFSSIRETFPPSLLIFQCFSWKQNSHIYYVVFSFCDPNSQKVEAREFTTR